MSRCNDKNRKDLMNFVLKSTFDDKVINMDCTDGCEKLSRLAERVVAGEKIEDIMPELEEHMKHWKDCREEFDALVAILRAEHQGALARLNLDLDVDKPEKAT